jgi:hypothetical protein
MTDNPQPLKIGDKVFIKKWEVTGVVTHARPSDSSEDEYYEVQARPYFFHRSGLELDTSDADKAKHKQALKEKAAALDLAWQKVAQAVSAGHVPSPEIINGYANAEMALRKEQGVPSLFEHIIAPPAKK